MPEQTVFPMMAYEDAAAAMDWLVRAFGFVERRRMTDKQGRVVHGERPKRPEFLPPRRLQSPFGIEARGGPLTPPAAW